MMPSIIKNSLLQGVVSTKYVVRQNINIKMKGGLCGFQTADVLICC